MRALALIPVLALTACATPPNDSFPPDRPSAGDWNDCAIIAAVARDHYRFGPDNVPPPLWLDGGDTDWNPRCDWREHGVDFPRIHDPDARPDDPRRIQWVSFKRPQYMGEMEATIEASIMHGPLAGIGVTCRVRMRSGLPGWALLEPCRDAWIS